jgi:hypothetical protein
VKSFTEIPHSSPHTKSTTRSDEEKEEGAKEEEKTHVTKVSDFRAPFLFLEYICVYIHSLSQFTHMFAICI